VISDARIGAPLLQVTDGAREEVLALRAAQPEPEVLALWVEITGVSGDDYSYDLALRPLEEAGARDLVEHHGDLPVVVGSGSVAKLRGATVDLVGDLATGGGLIVDNPNSPSPAVDDYPPLEVSGTVQERVAQVLQKQVNPSIASHGGRAELVGVEGDRVLLRLSGGCQGCGLASVTLRRGIEVAIKRSVPEVAEIVDVTDHAAGTTPYFEPSTT
jgi:Fe/S biogenesis protein NfuA